MKDLPKWQYHGKPRLILNSISRRARTLARNPSTLEPARPNWDIRQVGFQD